MNALPTVENVAGPVAGAVHENHSVPEWVWGSPGCSVAWAMLKGSVPFAPVSCRGEAKSSLAGRPNAQISERRGPAYGPRRTR